MIDRDQFFGHACVNPFGGAMKQGQVDGCNAILDAWEARPEFTDRRWLAYILATAKHETARTESPGQAPAWSVDDAPRKFIEGQLRAIVGLELRITRIEAKAKLSQNRPETDIAGVVAGLAARGDVRGAEAVERANQDRAEERRGKHPARSGN